jgi:hypothetical protein
MKPKITTIPDRPHPPRLRKAPGVVMEKPDSETGAPPPPRRRMSRTLGLSIVAHVVILLGAAYWVIARHPDAPPPVVEPEGDPFPLLQRSAPESSPEPSATKQSMPLALRPLPQPDLPQPVLEEFLTKASALPMEMPGPMFVETPPEPAHAKDMAMASQMPERHPIKPRKKPGGGAMNPGKPAQKTAAASASSGTSGGSTFPIGQLDGKPQLLRHPPAVFPAELIRQGATSGTVVLDVELEEDGSVHVLGTVSSTHPALVAEAKRVAAGSRFTPPKHDGRIVKAHMKWPIVIRK